MPRRVPRGWVRGRTARGVSRSVTGNLGRPRRTDPLFPPAAVHTAASAALDVGLVCRKDGSGGVGVVRGVRLLGMLERKRFGWSERGLSCLLGLRRAS